jgi:uncharacterized protein (DUF952 family)
MADQIAYKILTADEWAALSAGVFHGAPIDKADGFIHLSTARHQSSGARRCSSLGTLPPPSC